MFERIVIPFGADLLTWVVVFLLRTNATLRALCPLPGGAEVLHLAGDRHDWRRNLPGVTDEIKNVRDAEEQLSCIFVGVDDGKGRLHLREDADGNALPARLLPDMKDVLAALDDDLTTSERRLVALSQEPAAAVEDPLLPTVNGSLTATVRRLEWARGQGWVTSDQAQNVILALLALAHQRIKAKAVESVPDIMPARLNAWAQACGRTGWTDEVRSVLVEVALRWDNAILEATADVNIAERTTVALGPDDTAPQGTLVMGLSRSPEFGSLALRATDGPCLVVQNFGDGRYNITARDISLTRVVAALRKHVAEEDVADTEEAHLADIGRPTVGGERTPIFLDARKRVAGNQSEQNPFLRPVWVTVEDLKRLIIRELGATP